MVVSIKGGKAKIRYEKTGKLGPKVYPSKGAAEKRIGQLKYFKAHPNK